MTGIQPPENIERLCCRTRREAQIARQLQQQAQRQEEVEVEEAMADQGQQGDQQPPELPVLLRLADTNP